MMDFNHREITFIASYLSFFLGVTLGSSFMFYMNIRSWRGLKEWLDKHE